MDSPLIYLTLHSMRNRLRVRFRRLREPRYAIGLIFGLAYFGMIFGRPYFIGGRRTPGLLGLVADGQPAVHIIAACVLLVVVALAWAWPSTRRPALAFTQADVQLLFTAPISRRRLVRYKLLRSQIGAFFGSAVMTFFMRPASLVQAWTTFIGITLTMAILNLHFTGISFTRVPGASPGRMLRRWLPLAVVLAIVAGVAIDVRVRWPSEAALAGGSGMSEFARIATSGWTGVVLWPFRAVVALPLAGSARAFVVALPWALLVLAVNYTWVVRTDVAFEEGSAELSEKMARVRKEGLKALRPPRRAGKTPFTLAPIGPSETAILWKNLISMGRFFSWTTLLRLAPLVAALALAATSGNGNHAQRADLFTIVSLMIAGFTVVLGPQLARSDLRQDLPNLAVLRTWPMRGATLVRGEVLAPAIVLISIVWLALMAAAIFSMMGSADRRVPEQWSFLVAALAIAPGLIVVQLLIQNALAVTFPSWVSIGPARGGVDVMGQRMLLMVASVVGFLVAVLPAAIVGGGVALLLRVFTPNVPIVLPGLMAAAVLLGEAVLGSELVGSILDRTDVTALDPADG